MIRFERAKWVCVFLTGILAAAPVAAQDEALEPDEEGVALEREPWTGRFDLGYTWQSGRTEKNDLSIRGQAEREWAVHRLRGVAEFLYGQADGEKNTHRYKGELRWRRSLSERLFFQSITLYEADRIREINHRAEQNVGIGYRIYDTDRLEASVAPGVTLQYTDQAGVSDHWDYLATMYQDLVWKMTEAYRFEEEFTFMVDPGDTDDYLVRFNAGIVGTLRQNINLSVRYHLLYENQTPVPGKTDHRLITSIGYAF